MGHPWVAAAAPSCHSEGWGPLRLMLVVAVLAAAVAGPAAAGQAVSAQYLRVLGVHPRYCSHQQAVELSPFPAAAAAVAAGAEWENHLLRCFDQVPTRRLPALPGSCLEGVQHHPCSHPAPVLLLVLLLHQMEVQLRLETAQGVVPVRMRLRQRLQGSAAAGPWHAVARSHPVPLSPCC